MKPIDCATHPAMRCLITQAADEILHLNLTDVQDAVLGLLAAAGHDPAAAPSLRRLSRLLLDAEMDDYYADASPDLTCLFA